MGLFAQEETWQAQTMQGQTDNSDFMLGINDKIQVYVSNINCPEETKG